MSEKEMSQLDLSALSTLDQNKISRLLRSATRADRDDLEALLTAFTDRVDRYRLIAAHIQDEIPEAPFKEIEIHSATNRMQDHPVMNLDSLPRPAQSALRFLLKTQVEIPSINDIFIDLARAIGWEEKSQKPEKPAKYGGKKARFAEVEDQPAKPVSYRHGKE